MKVLLQAKNTTGKKVLEKLLLFGKVDEKLSLKDRIAYKTMVNMGVHYTEHSKIPFIVEFHLTTLRYWSTKTKKNVEILTEIIFKNLNDSGIDATREDIEVICDDD